MTLSTIPNLPAPATASSDSLNTGPPSADQRASAQSLLQAVRSVNAAQFFGPQNEVTFIKDRASNEIVTRVINRDSREVVLQIPTQQVLRLAEEISGS